MFACAYALQSKSCIVSVLVDQCFVLKLIIPHLRRATKELHVHFQPGDMNVQHAWFTILGSIYDPSEWRHKMISFVVYQVLPPVGPTTKL
jgi:hypothetical protein